MNILRNDLDLKVSDESLQKFKEKQDNLFNNLVCFSGEFWNVDLFLIKKSIV